MWVTHGKWAVLPEWCCHKYSSVGLLCETLRNPSHYQPSKRPSVSRVRWRDGVRLSPLLFAQRLSHAGCFSGRGGFDCLVQAAIWQCTVRAAEVYNCTLLACFSLSSKPNCPCLFSFGPSIGFSCEGAC